jgi:putative ABC transport system permease protein
MRATRDLGTGVNHLWRKAPLALFRYPGLFAAVAAGCLLLVVAAAAYPLFISATASDLVNSQLQRATVTRFSGGITYEREELPFGKLAPSGSNEGLLYEQLDTMFRQRAARNDLLGPTLANIVGGTVSVSPAGRPVQQRTGRLFAGDQALQHVRILEGTDGDGVWLPDLIARALHLGVGDRVHLSDQGGHSVGLVIDGVYRSLYTYTAEPLPGYWLSWREQICGGFAVCSPPPPQFMILDRDQLIRVSKALGIHSATFLWQAPLREGADITLEQATDLQRFAERFKAEISDDSTYVGRAFACCDVLGPRFFPRLTAFRTAIDEVILEAERRVAALEGPAVLLRVAGILVALLVVGAAGTFALAAREVDAGLLFARGEGPFAVGTKGSLESLLPGCVGGAVGLGLTFGLVVILGPDGAISDDAIASALQAAALAVLGALVLLGLVSAVSFLHRSERHRDRLRAVARLPWEIALIALAVVILRRLQTGGAVVVDNATDVRRPSPLLLLFPVLFLAGFAAIGSRLLPVAARWLRPRSGRLSSWAYLAVHRLAAAPRLVVLLVAGSAISLGILVQGQALVSSLETTVDAKAKVFLGSDVQGRVDYQTPVPESFAMPMTRVVRRLNAGSLQPTGPTFDLLAIDSSTFVKAAYWNDNFAQEPLQQIMDRLDDRRTSRVPVVVAGGYDYDPATIRIDSEEVPVDVVAWADAFPGMSSLRPLIVVGEAALAGALTLPANPLNVPSASTELWVRGDEKAARRALARLEFPPTLVLSASEIEDIPYIAAVVDTFVVLNGLGLAASVLVIAAMLMYLQSRQRSQVVSYGLSLRMGMTHDAHRRSLVAELGTMLWSSYAMAVVLALLAVVLMMPMLDPLEAIPPGPLFVSPTVLVTVAFGVLAAITWLGGWLANRRARRLDFGEVMRLAG